MKVWLDDFRPVPDNSWTLAKTVEEAKKLFLTNEIEDASFDNDLAGSCPVDCWQEQDMAGTKMLVRVCGKGHICPCHEEGYQLVDWLEATNRWPQKKPKVHSANAARASYMRAVIDKHYG